MSVKLQEAARDAILNFKDRNEGVLPDRFLVYRGNLNEEEWATTKATEIDALERVFSAISCTNAAGEHYSAKMTFVAVTKWSSMRFFLPAPNVRNVRNPEAGTCI